MEHKELATWLLLLLLERSLVFMKEQHCRALSVCVSAGTDPDWEKQCVCFYCISFCVCVCVCVCLSGMDRLLNHRAVGSYWETGNDRTIWCHCIRWAGLSLSHDQVHTSLGFQQHTTERNKLEQYSVSLSVVIQLFASVMLCKTQQRSNTVQRNVFGKYPKVLY